VDDIETKVEQLLELYLEDRKRLLELVPSTSASNSPPAPSSGGGNPPTPPVPANTVNYPNKPRPILTGKQVLFCLIN